MEGVWVAAEAEDSSGASILSKTARPIVAFHLSSDRTMLSTAGPVMMYIVYGDNSYTQIASTIDQVFNYVGLDFYGGEFFIAGGVVDRFTLEMKLEGLPGQKALTDLLGLLGIGNDYLDVLVYHKFVDVKVEFGATDNDTMVWTFDDTTWAEYSTKDYQGNKIPWLGWPVTTFTRCRFVLARKVQDLRTLVGEATNP
jgi:hypothetical protein